MDTLNENGASPDDGAVRDMNVAGKNCSRSNVHVITDLAIMIDLRPGI